jgi:hypothetical protein
VARPRTYGGWRRPTSPGLYGLGSLGTVLLFAGLIAVIVVMRVAGLIPAVLLGIAFAVGLSTVLVRDRHGRSGASRLAARAAHTRAEATGATLYRSGPLSTVPGGRFRLPGLAAASELSEHVDATGRPFAVLHHPHTDHAVIVLGCEPDGAALVDPGQTDAWVAGWGAWLAGLGVEPDLAAASVTVATAPDPGTDLASAIATTMHPDAPALAAQVLGELAADAPAGQSAAATWVALTFTTTERTPPVRAGALAAVAELGRLLTGRAGRGATRPVDTVAADLAGRLPALTHSLAATGAGTARPLAAAELCAVVAQAYRPGNPTPATDWADVGPAAAQADWDSYRHDDAVSMTWSMTAAPRGAVHAGVLTPLLAAVPDVPVKRVTLTYRPLDPAAAAAVVEADRRAASFRLSEGPRPAARVLAEHAAAEHAAVEEAGGAGLVDFALLVTATVDDPARLPAARSAVANAAAVARLQLLPCYGAQDAAFTAALPLGLHLPAHIAVPHAIRNTL